MTVGEVLGPLRDRYGVWLAARPDEVDAEREDPAEIRALQLVLRLERDGTPSRTRALELAATACALVCLDDRSAPGGEWHEEVDAYCRGRIRKVTRRARGAQWEVTADLPGITLRDGGTEIRALVPGLVSDLDRRVAKLQVGGTDIAPGDEGDDASSGSDASGVLPSTDPVLSCAVPAALDLTAGKLMAQTGHAGMIAAALAAGTHQELLRRWYSAGCPARVAEVDDERWCDLRDALADPAAAWDSRRLVAVRDAGFTEVDPGTITVIASLGGHDAIGVA